MKGLLSLFALAVFAGAFQMQDTPQHFKVLPPVSQGNLTVFPVSSTAGFDTGFFLTLDEGIRYGEVLVTEAGEASGLVRSRPSLQDGVWREQPPLLPGARVNELSLINNSDRPLLLLGGEIVTGGKQDRIVSKDRIIPAHSEPVALGVFCVEPHRWTETTANFSTPKALMAQPSVRSTAMASKNQQAVWNQVAIAQSLMAERVAPAAAPAIHATSSYAGAMHNSLVEAQLDSVAKPLAHSYDGLIQKLRAEHAVGAVVAVNGEIVWADVFVSSDLLNRFWPKLIRSYAAESFVQPVPMSATFRASQEKAQAFLDELGANHRTIDSVPGLFRSTEIRGDGYSAFLLTALLPGTGFDVHLTKMKR